MLKAKSQQSGQAVIEYILMSALVVGIIMGVMYPIMEKKLNEIQDQIAAESVAVISQSKMGIPFCWFYCYQQTFEAADVALNGAGQGGQGGAGGRGNSGGAGNRGRGSDSGVGGGTDLADNSLGNDANRSGRRGSGTGGDDEGDDPSNPKNRDIRTQSGGGGSGNFNSEGGTDPEKKMEQEAQAENEKEGEEGSSITARNRKLSRPDENRAGGCQDVDFFTILKIVAVIAVLILLGAVALSSRGRKK